MLIRHSLSSPEKCLNLWGKCSVDSRHAMKPSYRLVQCSFEHFSTKRGFGLGRCSLHKLYSNLRAWKNADDVDCKLKVFIWMHCSCVTVSYFSENHFNASIRGRNAPKTSSVVALSPISMGKPYIRRPFPDQSDGRRIPFPVPLH